MDLVAKALHVIVYPGRRPWVHALAAVNVNAPSSLIDLTELRRYILQKGPRCIIPNLRTSATDPSSSLTPWCGLEQGIVQWRLIRRMTGRFIRRFTFS